MRIHVRRHDGLVVTDHPEPQSLFRNGGAAGVLFPDALAISTLPLTSHEDTAAFAGREFTDGLRPEDGRDFSRSMRLQMCADLITCELWTEEADECPYREGDLAALWSYVSEHPKMRWMARAGIPFEIVVMTDSGPAWVCRGEGVEAVAEGLTP